MDQVYQVIGWVVLYGGTAATVAIGLFVVFGERWIGNRFDRAMETFKDGQAREMEHLRYQISGLLDRTTKLHEREFQVVPEAWQKLLKAYNETVAHTSGRMGTAVEQLAPALLEEFLAETPLTPYQKEQVRNAPAKDKRKTYNDLMYLHESASAQETARQSSIYLQQNGIFIRNAAAFRTIDDLVWEMIRIHGLMVQHHIMPEEGKPTVTGLEQEGKKLLDALEIELHASPWAVALQPVPKA